MRPTNFLNLLKTIQNVSEYFEKYGAEWCNPFLGWEDDFGNHGTLVITHTLGSCGLAGTNRSMAFLPKHLHGAYACFPETLPYWRLFFERMRYEPESSPHYHGIQECVRRFGNLSCETDALHRYTLNFDVGSTYFDGVSSFCVPTPQEVKSTLIDILTPIRGNHKIEIDMDGVDDVEISIFGLKC